MTICKLVHWSHIETKTKLERPGPQGDVRRPPCQCWPSGNILALPCPRARARARGSSFAAQDERFLPSHRPGATPVRSVLDNRLQHSNTRNVGNFPIQQPLSPICKTNYGLFCIWGHILTGNLLVSFPRRPFSLNLLGSKSSEESTY